MRVGTVRGAMAVDRLGTTLMHEHVFVLTPDVMQNYGHEWWDEQDRVADAVRQLQALKDAGVDSIVDPTHNPFTRDGIRVENAVPHYVDLPESLLALLRSKVEAAPEVEAIVEAQITAMLVHNPARYFTGGQE